MEPCRRDLLAAASVLATALLAGCLADDGPTNESDDDSSDGTGDGAPTNGDGEPADGPNGGTDEPSPPADPAVADETLQELVAGNTAFAFDLYEWLVDDRPDENLVVSPYSVSIALAMTYAGARGETATEMEEALQFTLEDDVHPAFAALATDLAERDEDGNNLDGDEDELAVMLRVANALWAQEDYPFHEAFVDLVEEYYAAGLTDLDFESTPEAAREEINAWVEERTEGLIEELLPSGSIDATTRLVLTNALYFRGDWAYQFAEHRTEDGDFTALDGSTSTVQMMHHPEPDAFPYADLGDAQAVDLAYVGGALAMTVIVPGEGTFEAFENEFSPERLETIGEKLAATHGEVVLPRFEHATEVSLPDALADLGMPSAFSSGADFGGMVEGGGLWIDDVLHESIVTVDEEGTEAAAATAVAMDESAPPEPEFELVVDRPFLYLIRDRVTETILFVGRVIDAGAARG